MLLNRDDNGFGGRRVALVSDAVDGDEDVSFGEVGGHADARNGLGDDGELLGCARVAFVVAGEVDEVAFG